MTKYRLRLPSGRLLGPFEMRQLFELKLNGHISGNEEAQVYPTGNWEPISRFEFFSKLMDANNTLFTRQDNLQDETFSIDLTKLRIQKKEKEIDDYNLNEMTPIEELAQTVQMPSGRMEQKEIENKSEKRAEPSAEIEYKIERFSEVEISSNNDVQDQTLINPVAQQELERMRRLQKISEAEKIKENKTHDVSILHEIVENRVDLPEVVKEEMVSTSDTTQIIQIDQNSLMEAARRNEKRIELESIGAGEQINGEKEDDPEDEIHSAEKKKKKKLILLLAGGALLYAIIFPAEKPKTQVFKHLDPQIVFPIPYDVANEKKSQANFKLGLDAYNKGTYRGIIEAGLYFKESYENDYKDPEDGEPAKGDVTYKALGLMVRSYAEQLQYSQNKLSDAQTIFNIIQSKRPFLIRDPNGVIGINLFYVAINKIDAANDAIDSYLKLEPKNVSQDLFAIYILSLINQGKVDVANTFYKALLKAPEKTKYSYRALIEYNLLNQEAQKAMGFLDEGLKRFPKVVSFHLLKAQLLINENQLKEAIIYLKKAESLELDFNKLNQAKFFELNGLILARTKKAQDALKFLKYSLRLNESDELRLKISNMEKNKNRVDWENQLIDESNAIKLLLEAKSFFEKKNYQLAFSYAAKATDVNPGHIPSELFLAKVQLRQGLIQQGIKTIEDLHSKYPDDKSTNLALIDAYIETYRFQDAKNRLQIFSSINQKETWEYASATAKLYMKMGDFLQAMSWYKTSILLNPLNDYDIFQLVKILLKNANFNSARLNLIKCMEIDPLNPEYRIAYARLLYETQDDLAAIGYLLNLKDSFGEDPRIMSEIAIFYYRSGKVKDFMDYKTKLEKEHSADKALYEFLIKSALMDERFSEIPPLVEKIISIEPADMDQMMTAGRVLFDDGKLTEAEKWFMRVREKLPTYPKVLFYIAKIKFLSGDIDSALKHLKEDIKANGENDEDLVFMAEISLMKDDLVEAENLLKRAQKINPKSYDALVGLADLSTKRSNHDLALDLYKRAIKLNQDAPLVHKKIGDVYRQLGQGVLAIEAYKLYLEMDPESQHKNNLEAYINLMK